MEMLILEKKKKTEKVLDGHKRMGRSKEVAGRGRGMKRSRLNVKKTSKKGSHQLKGKALNRGNIKASPGRRDLGGAESKCQHKKVPSIRKKRTSWGENQRKAPINKRRRKPGKLHEEANWP